MPIHEPSWWYMPKATAVARVLRPIGRLYGWAADRRYRQTVPFDPGVPVICIGNFTAGGTGKTPLAIAVAGILKRLGERPIYLSRGYGGSCKGPHVVDPSRDTAVHVGDEPLLLAAHAPVVVGRDRRRCAEHAVAHPSQPTVIVMDDGLQNPSLLKCLSLALVDGGRGFGNGEVIPAGPLRASLASQVHRVDAIVINHGVADRGADADRDRAINACLPAAFRGQVLEAHVRVGEGAEWLKGAAVVAYAGIGNPDRFFRMLQRLGARVVATRTFADHHAFREPDAAALLALAAQLGARLVTTEKDLARLSGGSGQLADLAQVSRSVPIELAMETRDAGRLSTLLTLGLRSSAARGRGDFGS